MNTERKQVLSFPTKELLEARERIQELEGALQGALERLRETKEDCERRIESISLEADLAIQKMREERDKDANLYTAWADHCERQAYKSDVTGLPNRRRLHNLFVHEAKRRVGDVVINREEATERGKPADKQRIYRKIPFCLVIIDLDDFKPINDVYGHPNGDSLLRQFGEFLVTSSRFKEDVVFHLSGDEFALFLDDTNIMQGRKLLARIRKDLRQHTFFVRMDDAEVPLRLHASIGIAKYTLGMKFEEIFLAADKAMYKDKAKRKVKGREGT